MMNTGSTSEELRKVFLCENGYPLLLRRDQITWDSIAQQINHLIDSGAANNASFLLVSFHAQVGLDVKRSRLEELLRKIELILLRVVPNATVSRDIGSKFCLLINSPPLGEPINVAKTCQQVANAFCENEAILETGHVNLTTKTGFVADFSGFADADDVYSAALLALHEAKISSTLCFRYNPINHPKSLAELVEQLAGQNGQIRPYFQPQIICMSANLELEKPTLRGVEALARIVNLDDGKIILPEVFIPLLKKHGWLSELDLIIFRESLLAHKRWLTKGRNIPISCNLSTETILDEQSVQEIVASLQNNRDIASAITIEVTESDNTDNTEQLAAALRRIAQTGAKIALDDFGDGNNGPKRLAALFPILDEIKIDRQTVSRVCEEDIVAMATVMAAAFTIANSKHDIWIVFEGVTSQDQLKILDNLVTTLCSKRIIQGNFFSGPLSEAALLAFKI
ncbi:EAL domain-containing protein [Patescibacteria group bacterium]|nr:EAL domain-containing protein [Patescibacteria group bacterium]